MTSNLPRLLLLCSVLTACVEDEPGVNRATPGGAGGPGAAGPGAPPAGAQVQEKADPLPTLDKAALESEAKKVTLVPSPSEMQNALKDAGIAQGLSALVPTRAPKMDVENKDVVAVRTGTVLAWALLTVKDAPTASLVERMGQVKAGMASLGAGADIAATIDDITARLNNDSLSRDDLLTELDEMHGAIIPEIEYEAGPRSVPLIQAGSWLAGVNLIAATIVKEGKPEAGTKLLRQPEVADHFLEYVRAEGADKAPPEVMSQLEKTLITLKELAAKPELTLDDVKTVQAQTDGVLALL